MPIQSIPVSEAQPGMITMRDITDESGRVLIHSGSRLSPVAIRRLPLWEVKTIFIEVDSTNIEEYTLKLPESTKESLEQHIDTVLISEIASKVQNRFKGIDQDEFYKTYMTVLLKYLVNNNDNVIISGSC